MRRLPWHVAVRADRKAVLTALGVAVSVAFSLVSFAVPSALATESVSEDGPLANAETVVARHDGGRIADDVRARPDALIVKVLVVDLWRENVTLAAFEGARAPAISDEEARPGRGTSVPAGGIAHGDITLAAGAALAMPYVGQDWIVVSPASLARFGGAPFEYALLRDVALDEEAALRAQGYALGRAPGIEPFFQQSALEVARDLLLVVTFSSTLLAVFIYEFMRSEVREKRREIGLWRAIGVRVGDTTALLIARALAIASTGILVGIALGALVLGSAGTLSGSPLFEGRLPVLLVAALLGASLVASVLGALVPALSTARAPIREHLEAAP